MKFENISTQILLFPWPPRFCLAYQLTGQESEGGNLQQDTINAEAKDKILSNICEKSL